MLHARWIVSLLAVALLGAAPAHVRDFTYYGLDDVNAAVPASWMASHVDIVEDDGFSAAHAEAFKRAGGALALAYTDPTYVPYCEPPFRPPAGGCKGPIGRYLNGAESGWLHDERGERVRRRADDPHFGYQEVLDVGSAPARRAYAREIAGVLAAAPHLDGFVADDSGSPFSGADGTPGGDLFDGFENRGTEIRDDAQWIAAESAMLAVPGRPVIINGGDPRTWGPSYDGRFLALPSVLGQEFEGCFVNGDSGPYTDAGRRFEREIGGLLAVTARRKLALCVPTGPTDPAHRLYAYASWLLTDAPPYSVFGMNVRQRDGTAVYPEVALVPGRPEAGGSLAALRHGTLYARAFGLCRLAAVPIGPCTAIVNPSAATADAAALERGFRHRIELPAGSAFSGAAVHVVSGVPRMLAPASAAIVVR